MGAAKQRARTRDQICSGNITLVVRTQTTTAETSGRTSGSHSRTRVTTRALVRVTPDLETLIEKIQICPLEQVPLGERVRERE